MCHFCSGVQDAPAGKSFRILRSSSVCRAAKHLVLPAFLILFACAPASAAVRIRIDTIGVDPKASDSGFFTLDVYALVDDSGDPPARWVGIDLPFRMVPQTDAVGSITFNSFSESSRGFELVSVDDSRADANEYFFSAAKLSGLFEPPTNAGELNQDGEFRLATLYFELSGEVEGTFAIVPVDSTTDGPKVIGGEPVINPITGMEDPTQVERTFDIGATFLPGSVTVIPEPSSLVWLIAVSIGLLPQLRRRQDHNGWHAPGSA